MRRSLDGPEYMRRMRKQVVRSRVRILDHSPALELLRDADGAVAALAASAASTAMPGPSVPAPS